MSEYTQAEMCRKIEGWLGEVELNYEKRDDTTYVVGIAGLDCKFTRIQVIFSVGDSWITCRHILPLQVNEEQRPAATEFIVRANFGQPFGSFVMDLDDGELFFKMCITESDLLDNDETAKMFLQVLFRGGIDTIERYGNNLAAVIFGKTGGRSIEDLVNECES